MEAPERGTIGGTYSGNPLACAAALKVIEIMERENLAERSREIGNRVTERYNEMKQKYNVIGDIRGLGGMIGIEFIKPDGLNTPDPQITSIIIRNASKRGLLIEGAGTYNNVIRFLAPLVITDKQLEVGLDIIEESIKEAIG
jgi:4-aminobutyrate aminotransferase/(S)-3-amino-2-methylpropionate transaminase